LRTGLPSEGRLLGEDVSAFLANYQRLPEELRESVERLLEDLSR
jgi:hypothetical protein